LPEAESAGGAAPYRLAAVGTTAPTSWSYWVVPGRLLAGAYPGALDAAEHRAKIQRLLDAGIRAFINLTEADERGRGGQPFIRYEEAVQGLARSRGVSRSCLRFPVRDLGVPTVEQMRTILDAIDQALAEQRPVYLHCWGGVGRTGVVVACWMLRHGLTTTDSFRQVLTQLRQADRERGHRPSPENTHQEEFIQSWLKHEGQAPGLRGSCREEVP
jgi:protein-tyrosine phosphatase